MVPNKILYVCDPDKNPVCSKTGCYINGGPCRCTTNPIHAKTGQNGKPIVELLPIKKFLKEK